MRQADLFATEDRRAEPPPETPSPASVRRRLHALLEELRASSAMPWTPPRVRTVEHLFRNMTKWLPQEERDSLRRAFAAEMERLRAD
jgi:hypothetical protein